jgi:Na+/melibiose symporter-like transporter
VGISFSQFFMEGVPIEWRGPVVGARNAIMSIVSFVVTIASGQILSRMPFPTGYQVVFFIGFVGAVMTSYHIWRVYPAVEKSQFSLPVPPQPAAKPAGRRLSLAHLGKVERNYLKVIGLLFLFNLTNNMVAPLVPDLLVHRLALSDVTISLGTGLANMLVFTVSLYIATLTRRAGNRRVTALGAMLLAFHALALALARTPSVYLLSAAIGGLASGVLGTAQYNYHLDNVPEESRSSWLAWNFLLGNTAVLLGALGGPQVALFTGSPEALGAFGVLRFLFGLLILRWG